MVNTSRVRAALGMPDDFVLHSMRHTFLTRLGEAGVDAFTIMRIAGHSCITVSQKYVHPSNEAMERAFERLTALNERKRQEAATVSATVAEPALSIVM
jgi:site-specific recombinase XerD